MGGRVDVDLPVAQKQLIEHARVLVAAQVFHADGADQLECVGRSVHLNACGVDVEHLVAHGLDLCLGTAGADDLLRDAVLAALRLVPDVVAVLAFSMTAPSEVSVSCIQISGSTRRTVSNILRQLSSTPMTCLPVMRSTWSAPTVTGRSAG